MSTTKSRDIILRRRARFVASALGLTLSTPLVANADEDDATTAPAPPGDPYKVVVTNRFACDAGRNVPLDATHLTNDLARQAALLHKQGQDKEALIEIEKAKPIVYSPIIAELEAKIHLALGNFAAARAALEARASCNGDMTGPSEEISNALKSVREKTATVTIQPNGTATFDGVGIGNSKVTIYVEAGPHLLEVRPFDGTPVVQRRIAFAGGENETIEIEGGISEPCLSMVCLSPPPPPLRNRRGRFGVTIGPTVLAEMADNDRVVSSHHQALSVGASIAPFVRFGDNDTEVRVGVIAQPSGGRGFTMPLGGWTQFRVYPSVFSLGVGVASGYLIAPSPTRDAIGTFQPASSFYVEPHIPIGVVVGPLEIEHRLGFVFTSQDDQVRSRFGLSYISFSIGITWIPIKRPYEDDEDRAGLWPKRSTTSGR